MKHLVIGIGEIGGAILQVLSEKGYEMYSRDINNENIKNGIDVLHICFPYTESFIKEVKKYRTKYKPQLTIIYSSVPVGTTKQIPHAVHSPVEGKHPRLNYSLKSFQRFIGYVDKKDALLARKVWSKIVGCTLIPSPDWTEFLKLASTSKYGLNIVWADYMADIAEKLDMPYDYVKDWDLAYNRLYRKLKMPRYRKYVLDPPDGYIGGHCIVPNAELLNQDYPDVMLELIMEMGKPNDNI